MKSLLKKIGKRFAAWLYGDRTAMALSIMALAVATVSMIPDQIPPLYELQQRIEALAFDWRMRATLVEQEIDPMVVIVDIDEKSLAAEGQWPWPRARIATLVRAIEAAGAQSIVFDVTFPEPERNPVDQVLQTAAERLDPATQQALATEREALDGDLALASALSEAAIPTILGFTFTFAQEEGKGALPESPVHYDGDIDNTGFLRMKAHVGNLPLLQESATGSGFFTVLPDFDGVVRRVPTVLRYGNSLYPSLELEAMRHALGADGIHVQSRLVGDKWDIEKVLIGAPDDPFHLEIPTDNMGRLIVPYRGRSPQFRYVSATDVLNGRIDPPDALQNSVVLIGPTAEGMKDLRSTPVQAAYPGVEIHANAIFALFTNAGFPVPPSGALGADLAVIVLGGLLATVLFSRLTPLPMILVSFVLVGAVAGLNIWLWAQKQLVLSMAVPVITLIAITFIHVNFRFLSEARSRRTLKDSFGQYVPATLVDQMYADPDKDFGFDGESREMSVLFSDIRGFTTLSETLDPQELKKFLNAWFTPVTESIFRHQGTIDKYVGDMVMAFWGAPMRDTEHRRNALDTAFDILALLPRMQQEFSARGWPHIDVGIGINSGRMNVGDMGSTFRRSYTVLGDAVNLGSRLEGLTKYYGVKLIVGEVTAYGVTGFLFRHLDRVRVKGKAEPIDIFEAVCRESDADEALQRELAAHDEAFEHYLEGHWEPAHDGFAALAATHPERECYRLYLERIAELRDTVPAGSWDGIYVHMSK
jgi:adenylate cyclase